ncbi:MAG: hypothetical protein CMA02_02085, partial [Euryarchaeota archaeon]|nr:hypothetical protein [Euryarchaeota archaeon]
EMEKLNSDLVDMFRKTDFMNNYKINEGDDVEDVDETNEVEKLNSDLVNMFKKQLGDSFDEK